MHVCVQFLNTINFGLSVRELKKSSRRASVCSLGMRNYENDANIENEEVDFIPSFEDLSIRHPFCNDDESCVMAEKSN